MSGRNISVIYRSSAAERGNVLVIRVEAIVASGTQDVIHRKPGVKRRRDLDELAAKDLA